VSISAEKDNKAIMRQFWSVWEQGNIDLLDDLLAPEYVNHTLATPDLPSGPEGVKEVVRIFRSGVPDLRVVIEDMIAEGDRVATRYALEGTHGGDLFGIAPTGMHLSIKSMTVERLSGGKIVEHWRVTDELDMMRQLGAIGQPEGNPASREE
jgi:predicted ester cyclase